MGKRQGGPAKGYTEQPSLELAWGLVKASGAGDRPIREVKERAQLQLETNPRWSDVLILAFDTSGARGSVALLDGQEAVGERLLDFNRRAVQTLAAAIAELLKTQGVRPAEVGLVATTVGPGSFTGLRIGVTTAKAFAYAAKADVLGLSTLEVIAQQTPPALLTDQPQEIHAVLDARRRELFVGRFQSGVHHRRIEADRIVGAEAWLASLEPGTVVSGSGLERLTDRAPPGVQIAARTSWEPRAATVGELAWREYERGRRDDLWKLGPVYLRPSYAEEKQPAG